MIAPVQAIDSSIRRLQDRAFYYLTSIAVGYLLWQYSPTAAVVYLAPPIIISIVRYSVVHVTAWSFGDDIRTISQSPSTMQPDGAKTIVCPTCHGIRAYTMDVRDRDHDLNSCNCD